jgi:O-antigen biosynthesis protein
MVMDIVTPSPDQSTEFTWERYTSATSGEIKHEHYHRYFFSLQFCRQKVVLDIASGEGYGSALLGIVAQEVFGVEVTPEAVSHAARKYRSARVSFMLGDCIAIPLSDASVDVVVSFETLEHVADQKKFFCEIKRVLRPHGMLVISIPNVESYKEVASEANPLHVKELDAAEFRVILSENFANYRLFGQRSIIGSAITPDSSDLTTADRQQTFRAVDSRVYAVQPGIGPSTYFIGVASDSALPEIQHGLLDDRSLLLNLYELLKKRAISILELQNQLRVAAARQDECEQRLRKREFELSEVHNRADKIDEELNSRNDELALLRVVEQRLREREVELSKVHNWANRVHKELNSRNDELAQRLREREFELSEVRRLIASIYGSKSWRVTQPLRLLRNLIFAFKARSARLFDKLRTGRFFEHAAVTNRTGVEPVEVRAQSRPEISETKMHMLRRSGLFDEKYYCEMNPDVAAAGVSPLEHFFSIGAFEGRRPNPLFDPAYYLATYSDVAKAGVNPALHYFENGALEGRDPSPEFDTSYYIEANPDLATSDLNPLVHFLRFGAQEGRLPRPAENSEPKLHVLQRSGLFDEKYYRELNSDVAAAGISPLAHFFSIGAFEGRRPNPLFDPAYYLSTYPDVAKAGVNPALHYFENGALEGRDPSPEFDTRYYIEANPDLATRDLNPLVHFLRFGAQEGRLPRPAEDSICDLQKLQKLKQFATAHCRQEKFHYRPLLSVLMPTHNTQPIYLEAAVQSVIAQAYPNWELRIVDDGSSNAATLDTLDRIAASDNRIFVARSEQSRGISSAANQALHDARGEYVAVLDHHDELTVDALYEIVLALNADRETDVLYTDQDYISPDGDLIERFFKPDWSPMLFRGVMYIGHLLTVRRTLALEVDGFDSSFDPVQDFEFMLRISERTRKIRHISKVLYHWRKIRERVAGGGKASEGIELLQAAAVQVHLRRLRLEGSATPNPLHPHRVLLDVETIPASTGFDMIVHGRGVPADGLAAVQSALARTTQRVSRIVIPTTWPEVDVVGKVTVDRAFDDKDPNASDANRLSRFLAEGSGEFVLAMSAAVAIETDGWLETLALAAQESDVAVVCPAILSPDGVIAHAGLIMCKDGTLRPAMRGFDPENDGYAGSLSCAREISAAWGDAVLLRRSALVPFISHEQVFVTADYFVADLALRATRSGLRAICIPYVKARHLETIAKNGRHRLDGLLHQDIWAASRVADPFYNPNFVDNRADYT